MSGIDTKVILISQFELPYSSIGSWTSMYNYYLTTAHKIDFLICPKPHTKIDTVEYSIVRNNVLKNKLKAKILKNRYVSFLDAIEAVINPNTKYIIQLIDNFGIVSYLDKIIKEKYNRSNFYIQFFYHGFAPFFGNPKGRLFFESIDEMILLTNDSYKEHLNYYSILPCRFSVLQNGVNKNVFKPLSLIEKEKLKKTLNVENKTVFLWCSQDRPKKGLDFILDVWKRIYKKHDNIILWVIGANRNVTIDGVEFFGKIPNREISKYYQASSVYLFPSLCQEGFGLSLLEALACGNLCIASNNGGIPEVLNYGEYGILIKRPNFIEDWEKIINEILNNKQYESFNKIEKLPNDVYNLDIWSTNLNAKIENAKISMN